MQRFRVFNDDPNGTLTVDQDLLVPNRSYLKMLLGAPPSRFLHSQVPLALPACVYVHLFHSIGSHIFF